MNLTKAELERYSRHLLLTDVGEIGQQKLKVAKVLVIGAGGLGCPILQYLAAAGVGNLGVIDMDVVDISNLQRQILYTTQDVGKHKAVAAKEHLQQLNPLIEITAYSFALDTQNALELFGQYDLVVDGSDNFATRYLVNDAAVISGIPLVYGSIFKFEGQVAVFNYNNGPSYRCLFPDPPKPDEVPNCSEVGVLGVLPGMIGSMQANEALKIILGIGNVLSSKLLVYNALTTQTITLDITANPTIIAQTKAIGEDLKNINYQQFCGMENNNNIKEIAPEVFAQNIDNYSIVDVRELWEQPRIEHQNVINLPLPRIMSEASLIPKDRPVVMVCAKGIRSQIAIEQLQQHLGYDNLLNLTGGMYQLSKVVPS